MPVTIFLRLFKKASELHDSVGETMGLIGVFWGTYEGKAL